MSVHTRARNFVAVLSAFVLGAGLLGFGPAPAAAAAVPSVIDNPSNGVTSDVLPTAQINGVAWDQVVVGNTVYVAGDFTSARPAGAALGENESPRSNLMAYNLQTGVMTSWAPTVNAAIRVITASPDGSRIYIGGAFTVVNGQSRSRVAAFNTSDGSLVSGFAPVASSDVFAIAATDSVVYLGGWFGGMNSVARQHLAAVSASNGSLLAWAPTTNETVYGMGLTTAKDRLIIAGNFSTVNGSTMKSMASLDATTGVSYPFIAGTLLSNVGSTASMLSLKVVNDQAFSTGYTYGVGNFEGTVVVDAYTGAIQNMLDCHGDTYDSVPLNGLVYSVSHHHHCTNVGGYPEISPRRHYHGDAFTLDPRGTVATNNQSGSGYGNWAGQPVGAMVDWWNTWIVGSYTDAGQAGWTVEAAGDYLLVGGEFRGINGIAQQGLLRFGTRNVVASPSVGPAGLKSETVPNLVSIGGTTIKGAFTTSWDRDNSTITYKVIRTDKGATNPVATLTADSRPWSRPSLSFIDTDVIPGWTYTYYVQGIDRDGNSKIFDSASITASTAVDQYATNVVADSPSHYWRLDQPSGSSTASDVTGSRPLTLLSGVTSNVSGALAGTTNRASSFNGSSNGTSGTSTLEAAPQTFSLELWFKTTTTSGGKLAGFGNSSTGTSSSYDRHLYLNNSGRLTFGVYPGSQKTITTNSSYRDGQWHQAVATMSGAGTKLYVDGTLQASDSTATSAQSYDGYWRVGGDRVVGWTNSGSSNWFSGSIDEVAVYPTELTASRVAAHYSAGKTVSTGQQPVANFTATTTDLTASFNASASTDPDGTITAYGWEYGDGSRGSGATSTHAYATAGNYTVKLTVVDNTGNSATLSKSVTVAVDNQGGTLVAKDTFNRTQTRWGNAAIGGAWTDSGASYFSVDGNYGVVTVSKAVSGPTARLASVNVADVSLTTDVALNQVPVGGAYLHQVMVRVNGTSHYRLVLRVEPSGGIKLYMSKVVAGVETTLKTYTNTSFGYTAGQRLNLRFDAHGTSPTTLEAKVWPAGSAEPGVPTIKATDSAAELQVPGALAITAYTGSGMTSLPMVVTTDSFLGAAWVDTNAAPVVDFTTDAQGVAVAFDASATTDSDGTVDSYAWDFGDGSTGTGKTPNHTYAGSGTYAVTLTATDDDGASSTHTKELTVVKPNLQPVASIAAPVVHNLAASFDARGSNDPDGTIETYQWDFGDGEGAEGAQADHTYLETGTYDVTVTVTDNQGGVGTATRTVSLAANVVPTAAFTAATAYLKVSVNGDDSTDPDGTVASYAWDYGDGSTGTGKTDSHTYAGAGSYTVTLVVTDNDEASSAPVTKVVTVVANGKPSASFTTSVSDLKASVDAAASSDPEGAIASYAWDYGDGATGTGRTDSHTYTAAGTYTVTLVVTDDGGATDTTTRSVTVSAPTAVAKDAFDRTSTSGWGTADVGGAWTVNSASTMTLDGSSAVARITAGASSRQAVLNSVSARDVSIVTDFTLDKAPVGANYYQQVLARTSGTSYYMLVARLDANGYLRAYVSRVVSGTETVIKTVAVPNFNYVAGEKLKIRFDVSGNGTTTLTGTVWRASDTEPASPTVSTTDTTASLQTAGGVGLRFYTGSGMTSLPLTIKVGNFVADPK